MRNYPSRVRTTFQKTKCDIALDQIRAVDKTGLVKNLGSVHHTPSSKVLAKLQEMFA
ncbi:MAG: PemK-like protein [Blastopirellula sp.]|nr:MAG: PemK-like protein [Blastopirellula sp.]